MDPVIVKSVKGDAFAIDEKSKQLYPLAEGGVLTPGDKVLVPEGSKVLLYQGQEQEVEVNACEYCTIGEVIHPKPTQSSEAWMSTLFDSLQKALAEGKDPTEVLEPAESISDVGSHEHGEGAFIYAQREQTIASAGYDTAYANSDDLQQPFFGDLSQAIFDDSLTGYIIEGQAISGNVATLFSDNGFGFNALHRINGTPIESLEQPQSGEYQGWYLLPTEIGNLYIKPDGQFILDAPDNQDHSSLETLLRQFELQATDSSGQVQSLTVTLGVQEGSDATAALTQGVTSDDGQGDTVTILIERGSDELDLGSIAFDLPAILSQLNGLALSQNGVLIQPSLDLMDSTLTVRDQNGEALFQFELGVPTLDEGGNLNLPLSIRQLQPLDHQQQSDQFRFSIFVTAQDSDGDSVLAETQISVIDGQPSISDASGAVIETVGGATLTGNLLENSSFGADANGKLTEILGVELSSLTPIGSGPLADYVQIATEFGTLFVNQSGDFQVLVNDNLFHQLQDSVLQFSLPFIAEDGDGDAGEGTFRLSVEDGAAPTADSITFQSTDGGSQQTLNLTIERGSDALDMDAIGFDLDRTLTELAKLDLTSGGEALALENAEIRNGELLLLGQSGQPILGIKLNDAIAVEGDAILPITVTQYGPLDHVNNSDLISIPFFISASDSDHDQISIGALINVSDSKPINVEQTQSITEKEGGATLSGQLFTDGDLGADGAGGLVEIQGVDFGSLPVVDEGIYSGFSLMEFAQGDLFVDKLGNYHLEVRDNLDHGEVEQLIAFAIDFRFEDGDGDSALGTLTVNIQDGVGPSAESIELFTSDEGIGDFAQIRIARGSDQIDIDSIGFDVDAIMSAIASAGLSSTEAAITVDGISVVDDALVLSDSLGNVVFEFTLGQAEETAEGDWIQPISVSQLMAMKHDEGLDQLDFDIFISASDTDNDLISIPATIQVTDSGPTIVDSQNQITELAGGALVSGNLLDNSDFGADGAGGVISVNGVNLTVSSTISGGPFDGKVEIDVENGTLYVDGQGNYDYVADDNLNHGDPEVPLSIQVPFTATDSDGDSGQASLTLTVLDGAPPVASTSEFETFDAGAVDSQMITIARGSDQLNASSLGFDISSIQSDLASLNLTAGGVALDIDAISIDGNVMTIIDADNSPILTIALGEPLDNGGDLSVPVVVSQYQSLDHNVGSDQLLIPITLHISDTDNDTILLPLELTITDDGPTVNDSSIQLTEQAGVALVSGQLINDPQNATHYGADGSGQLTEFNGVALDTLSPVSGGNYDGYYEFNLPEGSLYVARDGQYHFEALDNLDHGDPQAPIVLNLPFVITDFDGDSDGGQLSITIHDGDGATSSAVSLETYDADTQVGVSSASATLQIQRGSDEVDLTSFQFDLISIASELAGMGLSSAGNAIDGSNLSLVGSTLTILDSDSNPVFELTLGTAVADGSGDASVPISINQLAALDHIGANSDSITIPIALSGSDIDNDPIALTANLTVNDDGPTIEDSSNQVTEAAGGSVVSGNLLDNSSFGGDGAGEVTKVNGVTLSLLTPIVGGAYDGKVEIDIENGTLYVDADGNYDFVADDNLNHGDPEVSLSVNVPFVARDSDYDYEGATLTLTVTDGAAPTAVTTDFTTSDVGSVDSQTVTVSRGSDALDPASLGFDLETIKSDLAALNLSSGGIPLDLNAIAVSGNTLSIADANNNPILTIKLGAASDNGGNLDIPVTVTQQGPLDHELSSDALSLPITLQISDSDNDVIALPLNLTITDSGPQVTDTNIELTEAEGGNSDSGYLFDVDVFGPDGAGQLTEFNGVALDTLSPISGGNYDGYYEFNLPEGSLYLALDGQYHFEALDNLDHGDPQAPIVLNLPFVIADFDGDSDGGQLSITIHDGDGATSSAVSLETYDADTQSGISSDSATLQIERGSDEVDLTSFQFDLISIASELAGMGLSSAGNAIDGSNLSLVGSTLTILDSDSNPVFELTLGTAVADGSGDASVPISINQLAPLDHIGASSDSIAIPIALSGSDTDNDPITLTANLTVNDDGPSISDSSNQVNEVAGGVVVSGNLLDNSNFGGDGAGEVTKVNGLTLSLLTPIVGGLFDGKVEIDIENGTLYVDADGNYDFVADDNLDHGNPETPLSVIVPFEANDSDGDIGNGNLTLTVTDGYAPTASQTSLAVDEADTQFDSQWLTISRGSDELLAGSLEFDEEATKQLLGQLNVSSGGEAIDTEATLVVGSMMTLFTESGVPIVQIQIGAPQSQPNGDLIASISTTLLAPLDHQSGDMLSLPIQLSARDTDNDSVSTIASIVITDAGVVASPIDLDSVVEGETTQIHNILSDSEFNMDGGQVFSVNGQELDASNLILDSTHPGFNMHRISTQYGEVWVDADGNYQYQANSGLDHGLQEQLQEAITVVVKDGDGDSSSMQLLQNVTDGSPPIFNASSSGLFAGQVDEQNGFAIQSQTLVFDPGSDPITRVELSAEQTILAFQQAFGNALPTAQGSAIDLNNVQLSPSGQSLKLFNQAGELVIEYQISQFSLQQDGSTSGELSAISHLGLDHLNSDLINLPVSVVAFDHDNDSVATTTSVVVVDASPQALDNSDSVIEGQVVTGNVIDNDKLGTDTAQIDAIRIAGFDLVPSQSGTVEYAISAGQTLTLETVRGSLSISSDGGWQLNADDNQLHPNDISLPISLDYRLLDSDGDNSNWAELTVSVNDGEVRQGGQSIDHSIREKDLDNNGSSTYPVTKTSSKTITDVGSDDLDLSTLSIVQDATELKAELESKLTSLGRAIEADITDTSVTLKIAGTNEIVATLEYQVVSGGNGPAVSMTSTLLAPLDHIKSADTAGGAVKERWGNIQFNLDLQILDIDGDPLQQPIAVTHNFKDGSKAGFSQGDIAELDEGGLDTSSEITASGTFTVKVNSDEVNPDSLRFYGSGHSAITSGGDAVVFSIDWSADPSGRILVGKVDGQLALKLTLDTLPDAGAGSEVSYSVTQYLPIDQDQDQLEAQFRIRYSDTDGDVTSKHIKVNLIDGAVDELTIGDTSHQLTEPNLGDSSVIIDDSQAGELGNLASLTLTTASDAISNIEFDYTSGQQLTGISHDGSAVHIFEVNGQWQAWSVEGGSEFNDRQTLIFTLESPSQLDSNLTIAPNSTASVPYQIEWHSFIDHNGSDSVVLVLPLKAQDSDGDSVTAAISLSILDGQDPQASTQNPSAQQEVNNGAQAVIAGTVVLTQGSDFVRYSIDTDALESNLAGVSSDGYPLSVIESGDDYLVRRLEDDGSYSEVMKVAFDGVGGYQMILMDNLDHTGGDIQFLLPILVADSDGDSVTLTPQISITDTDIQAADDDLGSLTEGQTASSVTGKNLLDNDQLGADADRAEIVLFRFDGNAFGAMSSFSQSLTTPLGDLSVLSDGSWQFVANNNLDHLTSDELTLSFDYLVQDGDGDQSWASVTLNLLDNEVSFSVDPAQGNEDNGDIALSLELNLGDLDQNESHQDLMIQLPPAGTGQLLLNGAVLVPEMVDGTEVVRILASDLTQTLVNGEAIVTIDGLVFRPDEHYSDFSADGPLNLAVSIDTTDDLNGTVSHSGNLAISVASVADAPNWIDTSIDTIEDPENFGASLFNSFSNSDGIYAELVDQDGSELLSYRFDSIPDGITLYLDGAEIVQGQELSAEDAQRVTALPDAHDAGVYTFGITAIATEQGNHAIHTHVSQTSAQVTVNVYPVVDDASTEFTRSGSSETEQLYKGDEDALIDIGNQISASSPDSDEHLFIRVQEVNTDGDNGEILYYSEGNWLSLTSLQSDNQPLPSGIEAEGDGFIIPAELLSNLAYLPDEDRSSATFDDVQIEFQAIARERTQDGLDPVAGFEESRGEVLTLTVNLRGEIDPTVLAETNGFTNEVDAQGQPTGRFLATSDEDMPLTFNISLSNADDDGSEYVNFLIRQLDPAFKLVDANGDEPDIYGFEPMTIDGQTVQVPVYQITQADMAAGTYQLTPPKDFAGDMELIITSRVIESDGRNGAFDNPLKVSFTPVIDTQDASFIISGQEAEVGDGGNLVSGGASIRMTNAWLSDRDGSETVQDASLQAPQGFAFYYQDNLITEIASVATLLSLTDGDEGITAFLQSGQLMLVPVIDNGGTLSIDPDSPSMTDGQSSVHIQIEISDQQNGYRNDASEPVELDIQVAWQGEVDGESVDGTGSDADENTRLTSPTTSAASAPFGVIELSEHIEFTSTDSDGSEVVEKYRISVPGQQGWTLEDELGNPLGVHVGNGVWLLEQGDLAGVRLIASQDGVFDIEVMAVVSDLGDQEVRSANFSVETSGTTPLGGNGIVGGYTGSVVTSVVDGSEDGVRSDGSPDPASLSGHINVEASGDADDVVVIRIEADELPDGASLLGPVIEVWNEQLEIEAYIIHQEDLGDVSVSLAEHQSGRVEIDLTVIITDPTSGRTRTEAGGELPQDTLVIELLPVADNLATFAISGTGTESENAQDNDTFALGLNLNLSDQDGSEQITTVSLTPQAGVTLFGDGLTLNNGVYQLIKGDSETDSEFAARIDSLTFRSEPGLHDNLNIRVEVAVLDSNNIGSDSLVSSRNLQIWVDPINNGAMLTSQDASGTEDGTITLSGLSAKLNDSDETLSLVLEGLPDESFLSAAGTPLNYNGDGIWQIPLDLLDADGNLPDITVLPPPDLSGEFEITLKAVSKEPTLSEFATDLSQFTLTIAPQADELIIDGDISASGNEGEQLYIDLNLSSSDRYFDESDTSETARLTFSLDPQSDSTLIAQDGEKPFVVYNGIQYPLSLVNGVWLVVLETEATNSQTILDEIGFNSGDGFGQGSLLVTAVALDKSEGVTTAQGAEVTRSIELDIAAQADMPTIDVAGEISALTGELIKLDVDVDLVNPDQDELSVRVSGLESGRLTDSEGNDVGDQQNDGSYLIDPDLLGSLYLSDAEAGEQTLDFTAISNINNTEISALDSIDVDIELSFNDLLEPENQNELDQLLASAAIELGELDENGLGSVTLVLPEDRDSDGDNRVTLEQVDYQSWGVAADDQTSLMQRFLQEYQAELDS
ncbi:retention module-containing protein [Ferrimonas aestuarii]|uniref:Retention module-containing protein n=1 Tax=Ferrimonas aestuarii TaxID=2569539 RepID=A0A4V5NZP8_9GAMM|nr:retention module-containing protein [Ferrimonas aestuarii]TKB57422.1 retention module-containing protein [Ferrimonas aestuarii]